MACLLHKWDGCTCTKCGATRHVFKHPEFGECVCKRCGLVNPKQITQPIKTWGERADRCYCLSTFRCNGLSDLLNLQDEIRHKKNNVLEVNWSVVRPVLYILVCQTGRLVVFLTNTFLDVNCFHGIFKKIVPGSTMIKKGGRFCNEGK